MCDYFPFLKVQKFSVHFSLEMNQLFPLVEKHIVAMHSLYFPFNMKDLISSISTSSVYRHHIERDISISAYLTITSGPQNGLNVCCGLYK